ncbi:ras of complex, roc, domain of DAPkinase domain-containing protein [Ditylenchus destructor]|nr:ras of complex, roc, domain of DAPkinase domain-containing protein [Ditylenchus destructor]
MITALKKKFASNENGNSSHSSNNLPVPGQRHRPSFPSPSSGHKIKNNRKSPQRGSTPAGVNVVSAELQKKFAHGVNFNMKVIIRGDKNSGKTTLWKRIQGEPFDAQYTATEEIQVANITWNYRTFDHIVKFDIWDVVDAGVKKRQPNPFLKFDNKPSSDGSSPSFEMFENTACDASVVDVYKNCNGVLLIFDTTKSWTWGYVQRELEKIPSQIPVLVMANKTDLKADRQVSEDECLVWLSEFERKPPSNGRLIAPIRFTQCSMKTAQGLKFLYNFFNVPFLFLQREYLENALEANTRDLEIAQQELDLYEDSGPGRNFESKYRPTQSYQPSPVEETVPCVSPEVVVEQPSPVKVVTKVQTKPPQNPVEKQKPVIQKSVTKTYKPKAAIPTVKPSSQRKASSASTSSGEHNQMVDMYEEDFDSNDEMQLAISKVPRPSSTSQNWDDDNLEVKTSEVTQEDQLCDQIHSNSLISPKSETNPWDYSNKFSPESQKSEDGSVHEAAENPNPLVRRFTDELEVSSGDESYNEALDGSDGTPSNACTVESSTSCSTTGFTHVVQKNDRDLPRKSTDPDTKTLACSSTTLTSISAAPKPLKGTKQRKKSKTESSVPGENVKGSKTKKKGDLQKKTTKKAASRSMAAAQSNLLTEDLGDELSANQSALDDYDPL